jgi:hypothetical protein
MKSKGHTRVDQVAQPSFLGYKKITYLFFLLTLLSTFILFLVQDESKDLGISKRISYVKKCLEGSETRKLSTEEKKEIYDKNFAIETFSIADQNSSNDSKEQDKRNQCAVDALGLPKNDNDVEKIMSSLFEAAQEDINVQVACHEIGHELGMRTWRELGNEGLVLGLELCTYGFYHGYMRAAIESSGGETRVPFLVNFCKNQATTLNNNVLEFSYVRYDFCAHGVGHAIGTADWDLDYSIELCTNFPISYYIEPTSGFATGGPAGWCSTGVFNEKFYYPWASDKPTLREKMEICNPIADIFKLHCAQYVTSNSLLPIADLKIGCGEYVGGQASGCYQGAMQSLVRKVLFPSGENKGLEYYQKPEKGAELVDSICANDSSGNCAKQFAADSLSTVQSIELVRNVCNKVKTNVQRDKCLWQVEVLNKEGIKYVDN